MKKRINLLIYLLCIFITTSCELLESHPYDVHITGETNINQHNIERIKHNCSQKEEIRFIFMGDTQRWYNETEDFVEAVNQRSDIDFVIHGGDISDFGATKEFMWQRDILNELSIPYVVIIGNHDYLGNGEQAFRKVFGLPNFSFVAGGIKFTCLDTNALDNSYERAIPDFSFIEETISQEKESYEKSIIAMHVPPFDLIFNNNVNKVFENYVKQYDNLLFCLHAHTHHWSIKDLFEDGVTYYGCDSIEKRSYLVFTIHKDKTYKYERIYF